MKMNHIRIIGRGRDARYSRKEAEMQTLTVAEHYKEAIGREDGLQFDLDDSGVIIPLYYHEPTEDEIAQMKSDQPVRMGLIARQNVLIILMKFGNLNWMDAPYSPHLSKNLTHLPDSIADDEGFLAQLALFNTADGELKWLRAFSLGPKFSRDLVRETRTLLNRPFSKAAYAADIPAAYNFTTRELVKQCPMIYRVQQ